MNPDNKSCFSMDSSNFEGIYQQNDNMAKEYYGLREKHDDVNRRAQPLNLEYHCEKENSLYPAVFVIIGYIVLTYH